jgi:hypothetical protein
MLSGLRGSLISRAYAARSLAADFTGRLGEASVGPARTQFVRWWYRQGSRLGPATGLRAIWDEAVVPLAEILGFRAGLPLPLSPIFNKGSITAGGVSVSIVTGHWDRPLEALWRHAVQAGLALGTPWALCINGRALRLVDTSRTYSRAFLEFDLAATADDPQSFAVLWGLLRTDSFEEHKAQPSLLFSAIRSSSQYGDRVGRALRSGVIDALGRLMNGLEPDDADLKAGFEESLTIVYRILFLLFAESRGLVPAWHPVYRDAYTVGSLVDASMKGRPRGLWQALQAISRVAHEGCAAGSLVVPAFNGRLFSPARSPMADTRSIDDRLAADALRALCTFGHHKIDYRDLGVEQLGTIYESVLDYTPAAAGGPSAQGRFHLRRSSAQRKSSGTFYTPQSITDFIVRRALHPLTADASPERILDLRIVDPAMGSAAFLVSACRYLARAYERALVRAGTCSESDVSREDRAAFRRLIAQRCLYGVDLNPTAVQLARLSLWLATLAAGKPLTFLDHRLVCGDSVLGASPSDVMRRPPQVRRGNRAAPTPLFPEIELEPALAQAVAARAWIAATTDDTVDVVREKEDRLQRLDGSRWAAVADLWCSFLTWPAPGPDARVFATLVDEIVQERRDFSRPISALIEQAGQISQARRFFHWTLQFPEAFFDKAGQPLENPGFDAVIGNPPWEVLNASDAGTRQFIRASGVYRHQSPGHINLYQLFVERALQLVKRSGRVGLLVPAGLASDHHTARLRRRLFETTAVDTLTGFDNRRAIFPIHRSMRFLIYSATTGHSTGEIKCRFGVDDPRLLEAIPDAGDRSGSPVYEVSLTPGFIAAVGGRHLTVPELRRRADVEILDAIVRRFRPLGDPDGWNLGFGRELNATDDRAHFHRNRPGLAVLEGKHIEPFTVHLDRAQTRIAASAAATLLDPRRTFKRMRLAYRDVASKTNRLSLIAALIPPDVVTTHSLFCLKSEVAEVRQLFLCGVFNSFVANYLVRQVMTTHLGSTTVEQLRVPEMDGGDRSDEIVALTRRLCLRRRDEDLARLQALVASSYELTVPQFAHVLDTFPLIPETERRAAFEAFTRLS